MASIAAAFGSSHSLMLASDLDDWVTRYRQSDPRMPYYDANGERITYADVAARAPRQAADQVTPEAMRLRFDEVQAAMAELKGRIAAARLDALVIVGDDQSELFDDCNMPSIGIYHGKTIRNAKRSEVPPDDWYRRAQMRRLEESADVHYPCHAGLAQHLIEGLVAREFDISAVAALKDEQYEGHAYSFIHRWYLGDSRLPVVPVFLNTYNPPNQPHPARCLKLGAALRELVESFPAEQRIGVIASGGLSHFIVEEELDRAIIQALRDKNLGYLAGLDPRRLKAGSSEIRSWITVAAAASGLDLQWVSYTPGYRTEALTGTGLCFAHWA